MTKRHIVAAIVMLVGLYDVSIGLYMLFSPAPQLAHGTSTLWAHAASSDPEIQRILDSLFARMGAFSFHAGLISIAWCLATWQNPPMMGVLLAAYLVTGLAFFSADVRYFSGTTYFAVKETLGALWILALVLNFWPKRA